MSIASELRDRITVQQLSASDDGYGGKIANWGDVATLFAQVQPIFGNASERQEAGQRSANAGYRVRIRYRGDITAAMRIIWKTHTLAIHSLHEQGEILSILTYEENV
jgi:SPP1 family predicted phage head-tail adaptor